MKLFKIAFSNIKKRKSGAITLAVITTMAVLMFAISLMLLFGIGSFFEDKAKEHNMSHITLVLSGYKEQELEDIENFAKKYKTTKTEMEVGYMSNIKYESGKNTVKTQMIFSKESVNRTMNTYDIIDPLAPALKSAEDLGIILPLAFKFEGFKSGGEFLVKVGSKTFDFKIYGFYESVQFGNAMSTLKMAYVTDDIFDLIRGNESFTKYNLLSINFQDPSSVYDFGVEFLEITAESSGYCFSITYDSSKSDVTMFPTIMAMVLILVSFIIVVVALIIARFTIINNIEEDIKTLGALKSIGFTNRQMKWSMVLQFLIIALIGAVFGSVLTVALGGVIGNIISSTSGLLWTGSSAFVPIIISVIAVTGVVIFITYLMANRFKKITPINALRAGLSNHSFKKNTAPFNESKMPLNLNIAAKNFRINLKNNITAFVMMIMFGFMTVLGFTLYHNFVEDTEAFKQMSGLEMGILVEFQGDATDVDAKIEAIKESNKYIIKKTIKLTFIALKADGKVFQTLVWDDINEKEADALVEGEYPKEDYEVSIPKALQVETGKTMGKWIELEFEGKPEQYLITGITNTPGNPNCDLTEEGFRRLKKDFVFTGIYVYLNDNSQEAADNFMSSITDAYGREIYMENSSEIMDVILGTIAGPIEIATFFIIGVEFFVICFVFFLMVNTIIRRKKKDSGIMKALGFTSRQLILQTFLSFLPVILGGVLIGTLLGVFLTNMLLGIMFAGLLAKAAFIIPPVLVAVGEVALIAVCILTVYLVSLKFRSISPQKLIIDA